MSGTQSPPLEFTGEETTLGASATNKPAGAANVKPDAEQRGGEWNFSPSAARRAPPNRTNPAAAQTGMIRTFGYRTKSV